MKGMIVTVAMNEKHEPRAARIPNFLFQNPANIQQLLKTSLRREGLKQGTTKKSVARDIRNQRLRIQTISGIRTNEVIVKAISTNASLIKVFSRRFIFFTRVAESPLLGQILQFPNVPLSNLAYFYARGGPISERILLLTIRALKRLLQ
jgi:hypothetical protein